MRGKKGKGQNPCPDAEVRGDPLIRCMTPPFRGFRKGFRGIRKGFQGFRKAPSPWTPHPTTEVPTHFSQGWGKDWEHLVLKVPEDFLWPPAKGVNFFYPPQSIPKMLRFLRKIQTWVKNTKKKTLT